MDTIEDDFVLISHSDTHPTISSSSSSPLPPPFLDEISSIVADLADSLWPVNKKIHDNPELGFREFIAHDTLVAFMRTQPGWKVTPSAYGMKTAWVAIWDSGRKGPVVSFNAEMDCLPGIGHACGHNLIATASLTGALVTATLLSRHALPGSVLLYGTPAEEGGGGKIRLLQAGAYASAAPGGHPADLNLISHPGIVPATALMRTSAFASLTAEFFGREAHAAANPWLGINALDALVVAYTSLAVLRQQTRPGDVIQCNISHGGVRPNIIHAYAAGHFVVRANTQPRLAELLRKVEKCFVAGAEATGATYKVTHTGAYMDHVPNRVLGRSYTRYFNALLVPGGEGGEDEDGSIPTDEDVDEIRGRTMASTDQGDVSYAMPSLSVGFAIPAGKGGQGPHNPEFAEAAGTRVAFERSLRVGKGLAGVAIDVFTKKGMLEEVKAAWKKDMGR
ncbi:amidohydrolase [Colletotrichum orchidophilum]|uniref:Peptidase M20 domain-containing protein 2 n=1 Tax=Colletotrichum orchidophilum TaxID=1209926 RepID=A0A1G4BQV0_9PEZI|nr:amidohydrolase [Colletotrichum orchidophilum]OHF03708.1 amidohydrolase [Colletotrichum orchidophilum]